MSEIQKVLQLTKKMNVLFVEDCDRTRETTARMFNNFFPLVDTAVDGIDGLEKYEHYFYNKRTYYDLVITDINMPKMTGYEMSRKILELNAKQQILIISAYNNIDHLHEGMDIGVSNYIHKPFQSDAMIKVLHKIAILIDYEKKQAEEFEKVKQHNNQIDALIKIFNQSVIASRTDRDGKITYVSEKFQTITKYSQSELLGKTHAILQHPIMPKELFSKMWITISSGHTWNGEIANLAKDGTTFWVKATISPYYNEENEFVGYSAIQEEIYNFLLLK